MTQTLAIIKPDATGSGKAGQILAHVEAAGFTLKAARMIRMTRAHARSFYAVHSERPFYDSLVETRDELLPQSPQNVCREAKCCRIHLSSHGISRSAPTVRWRHRIR